MKKISVTLSYLFVFAVLMWACKDEEIKKNAASADFQKKMTSPLTVESAKQWFNEDYLQKQYDKSSTDDGRVRKVFWERAFKSKMSNGQDIIIIPIKHHLASKQANADTYLWIFMDDNSRYTLKVIEYLSSVRSSEANIANFTGAMIVRDWKGTLLNGFTFKNGTSTGLLQNLDGEEPLRLKGDANWKTNGTICDQVSVTRSTCTDYYYKVCINGNCTDWTHNGTFCDLYEITYPKCYWVADFPGQTVPSTGSTMLPGEISEYDYANNFKLIGPKVPISNLKERLKCFGANGVPTDAKYKYKITMYIDQPVSKTRKLVQTEKAERLLGHTYLGMEQYNSQTGETKRLVFGFYTQTEWKAGMLMTTQGAWGDDGASDYDVSVSVNLSGTQFQNAVNQVGYLGTPNYHITQNNCSNVASQIMAPYLVMPAGTGEIGPLGLGMTPGSLGQDIYNNTSTYGPFLNTGNNLTSPSSICN